MDVLLTDVYGMELGPPTVEAAVDFRHKKLETLCAIRYIYIFIHQKKN